MRITTVICSLAIGLALLFFVYKFMIEGFQNRYQSGMSYVNDPAGRNMTPKFGTKEYSSTTCMKFGDGSTGDCAKCLDDDETNHPGTQCGYWPQGNACIPRSGIYRLVPQWLIDKQNMDKSYPQVFDPKDFVYNVGQCGGAACASFTSCKTCASAAKCGWCDTTNTCMDTAAASANWDAIGSQKALGSAGSVPPQLCPAKGSNGVDAITSAGMVTAATNTSVNQLIAEVGKCRPETCADKKGCFECTNTIGCGFCKTTGKCIKVDSGGAHDASIQDGGSTGSKGSSVCATGAILLQQYMCPCSSMTECKTCATQPGCGWCLAGKNCVNVDQTPSISDGANIDGGVRLADCAAGARGVATSATQCIPSKQFGNVRSEDGKYKPTDAELTMIGDNTAISDAGWDVDVAGSGVIGSGPVTAPKTTSEVSGNGVVRPVGATGGGPYKITNQPSLFTSPFEEYVKVLIKSELASQGVPTNEPFQNPLNYVTQTITNMFK